MIQCPLSSCQAVKYRTNERFKIDWVRRNIYGCLAMIKLEHEDECYSLSRLLGVSFYCKSNRAKWPTKQPSATICHVLNGHGHPAGTSHLSFIYNNLLLPLSFAQPNRPDSDTDTPVEVINILPRPACLPLLNLAR